MSRRVLACLAAAMSLAAADPVGGTFGGSWRPLQGPAQGVSFSYHREQEGTGRISVELPGSGVFVGEYLRLTGERSASRVERVFARWRSDGFDGFEEGPAGQPWDRGRSALESFRRKHRDRVVATLISEAGSSMRCSFALASPALGLPGGAVGRCQITDGSVIDVASTRSKKSPISALENHYSAE